MNDEREAAMESDIKDHLEKSHQMIEAQAGMTLTKDDEYRLVYGPSHTLEDLESLHRWDHGQGHTDHKH